MEGLGHAINGFSDFVPSNITIGASLKDHCDRAEKAVPPTDLFGYKSYQIDRKLKCPTS